MNDLVTKLPVALAFSLTEKDKRGCPAKVPGRGNAGWTLMEFADARAAAVFFQAHPHAAMPCWQRLDVVDGELRVVRP